MSLKALLFVLYSCLFALPAAAAGLAPITVPADANGPELKAFVWSPCAEPAADIVFGPVTVRGVKGCPVAGDGLPLVVISHGHAGSSLGHHDTAEALADAGFVVAAITHPGDNYADMSRSGDIATMVERPMDMKRLIDFMLGASPYAAKIDPARIGFFGFSRGGYTGLVLAGAKPDFHADIPCPEGAPICGEIRRNELPTQPLTHDIRIKAFVLADPLSFFPDRASLAAVRAPIQLWRSEFGGDGVLPHNVGALVSTLPVKPPFQTVPGSAHFAFLAPCTAALAALNAEICSDPAGFDRTTFHQVFNTEVVAFLRAHLSGANETMGQKAQP